MSSVPVERWLPVVGYEGLYEVSDLGRVRSLDRVVIASTGAVLHLNGRLLSTRIRKDGYLKISLSRKGVSRTHYVHRMVLESFVGPCPPGAECCHNDGNPGNARLENLRWDSHTENMRDSRRHGTAVEFQDRCRNGHPYTPENTLRRLTGPQAGYRRCKICKRKSRKRSA